MIKYFCDDCGKELSSKEVHFSMSIIGTGHYCSEHRMKHIQRKTYPEKDDDFNAS